LPRVYALALELIAHTDCVLDETNTALFVRAFQSVTPLTIGELWAVRSCCAWVAGKPPATGRARVSRLDGA